MKSILQQDVSLASLKNIFLPGISCIKTGLHTRPTLACFSFMGLILLVFLMSVNFSNNMIFAMTFLLAGICFMGWYQTRVNLKGLEYGAWRVSSVFAGQMLEYSLAVSNPTRSDRYGVHVFSGKLVGENEILLKAGSQRICEIALNPGERGIYKGIPADLRSRFPLGLFEARLDCGMLPDCIIYPKPVGNQPLPDQTSGQQAHLRKESGNYIDMRRYAPGDPLSHIAWKAMARTGELYTKEYDGASGQPALWLCWQDVHAAGTEQKLSQLCRWVLDAHHHGREYGLEIPGVLIQPACEEKHLRHVLRELALFETAERV